MKGNRKYSREYGTGCQSDKWLGLSLSMLRVLQMYIRCNILMSGKLLRLATG